MATPYGEQAAYTLAVVERLAREDVQVLLDAAIGLLDPPEFEDVHTEYVRGVVEVIVRTAGLTSDDVLPVLLALGYGDKADEVLEVLYARAA